MKGVTTKFNELQEISNPIEADGFEKTDSNTFIDTNDHHDSVFRGKSIDFDATQQHTMHTMEELNNEDLRDHDIIDNIMYIYYGSNVALRKSLGGSIIIVGTVFALAAQILTIIFTLLRNRYYYYEYLMTKTVQHSSFFM